jgi:hypothetical protein
MIDQPLIAHANEEGAGVEHQVSRLRFQGAHLHLIKTRSSREPDQSTGRVYPIVGAPWTMCSRGQATNPIRDQPMKPARCMGRNEPDVVSSISGAGPEACTRLQHASHFFEEFDRSLDMLQRPITIGGVETGVREGDYHSVSNVGLIKIRISQDALIGIDSYQMPNPSTKPATCFGSRASAYVQHRAGGRDVAAHPVIEWLRPVAEPLDPVNRRVVAISQAPQSPAHFAILTTLRDRVGGLART